jgi:hypothetical protein
LVTTFATIPDEPIAKFTLKISGGRSGLLVITGRGQTICARPQIAAVAFGAHSGAVENMNRTASTACGAPARLVHASVTGHTVRVTVDVAGAGKLTASGRWLRRQVRQVGGARAVTVVLPVSKASTGRLDGKHQRDTQVVLNWTPRGGGTYPMQTRLLKL